ncbi:MAG: hypothetical protein L6Q78_12370 [Bacteroidia bacterium]|nr:hypothetical protein [Bacteroidia bacterium]
MKTFLNKFGLWLDKSDVNPYTYSVADYITTDKDKIKAHKEFLKSIEAEENSRLSLIENKTSQLVSQTGIIFSLLNLFIPIFIDKVSGQTLLIRLLFLVILILAFLFYMLTIRNAIKNFNIKNFIYSKPSPTNVLKYQDKTTDEFTAIEIKDLLHGANQNLKTNNTKATNLIHSYNSFKVANTLTALLGVLICCSLLFIKPKVQDKTPDSNKSTSCDYNQTPKINIENNPVFINNNGKTDTTIIKKIFIPCPKKKPKNPCE